MKCTSGKVSKWPRVSKLPTDLGTVIHAVFDSKYSLNFKKMVNF